MTKTIDWSKIDNMLIAGCTITETAAAIGVSPDCLYARCPKEKNTSLSAYAQQKKEHGDALLLAAQYQLAINEKNPTMLIWLGKVRKGQREPENIQTVAPNQSNLDKDHLIMTLENRISELEANANKSKTE